MAREHEGRPRGLERTRRAALSRRRLLALGAGAAGVAACRSGEPRTGFLGAMEALNQRFQQALFDPDQLAEELPPGAETPPGEFPAYYISGAVPLPPAGWRLEVGGLVSSPASLTVADLMKLPRTDTRVRHYCVEGWTAVASCHGVRLRDLAEAVGASPRARYVEFRSFDSGYYSSWDRPSAFHPQTLLAYGRNGGPLTAPYGAPVRLYSAVKLGYKLVKYLTRVSFLPESTGGYWEDRGYEWFAGV